MTMPDRETFYRWMESPRFATEFAAEGYVESVIASEAWDEAPGVLDEILRLRLEEGGPEGDARYADALMRRLLVEANPDLREALYGKGRP